MNNIDKALETQLNNIQTKTGKTLAELFTLIRESGLARHGEMRDMLTRDLGLGHGDANTLVHVFRQSDGQPGAQTTSTSPDEALNRIYLGPKAALRPIHDKVMAAITDFGPFDIAPKKSYISLRRKKQFAMIGPATKTRVEVGLNMKGVEATTRLIAMPAGGMCQYKVNVTAAEEVDQELLEWIRRAYDSAG